MSEKRILPLIYYTAVVGPDLTGRRLRYQGHDDEYIGGGAPVVSEHFPPENIIPFPPSVENFVTPGGIKPQAVAPAPSTHTFVLTEVEGSFIYGWARTYWFQASDEEKQALGIDGGFLPHAVVILSYYPYYNTFAAILASQDDRMCFANSLPNVARDIAVTLGDLQPPAADAPQLEVEFSGSKFTFASPGFGSYPLANTSYLTLLSRLSPKNIVKVFGAMLGECRMAFVSSDLGALCSAITDLRSLLYPLTWPHIFIPVLPCSLLGVVEAPMPYIIGITPEMKGAIEPSTLTELAVVDLDNNNVTLPKDKGPDLPPRYVLRLCSVLTKNAPIFGLFHPMWRDDTPRSLEDIEGAGKTRQRVADTTVRTLDAIYSSDSENAFDDDQAAIKGADDEADADLAALGQQLGVDGASSPKAFASAHASAEGKNANDEGESEEESEGEYEYEDEDEDEDEDDGEYVDAEEDESEDAPAPAPAPAAAADEADLDDAPAARSALTDLRRNQFVAAASFPPGVMDPNTVLAAVIRSKRLNRHGLRHGFLTLFVGLMKNFWTAVRVNTEGAAGALDSIFDQELLLSESKQDTQDFMKMYLNTLLFSYFAQTRLTGELGPAHSATLVHAAVPEDGDLFDKVVISRHNSRRFQVRTMRSTALETNCYKCARSHPGRWTYRHFELTTEEPYSLVWSVLDNECRKKDLTAVTFAVENNTEDELLFRMPPKAKPTGDTREAKDKSAQAITAAYKKKYPTRDPLNLPKGAEIFIPSTTQGKFPSPYPLGIKDKDGNQIMVLSFHTSRQRRIWLRAIKVRVALDDAGRRRLLDRSTDVFKSVMKAKAEADRKVGEEFARLMAAK